MNTPDNTPTSRRHSRARKIIVGIVATGVTVTLLILAFNVWQYATSLSKKDYSEIEVRMDAVHAGMNVADLDKTRYCYDYRDGEGDPKVLKCSVAMAGYVNANESNVADVSEDFAKQLRSLTDSDEIWNRPGQGNIGPFKSGVINVNMRWL